jgi:hypothetical protein
MPNPRFWRSLLWVVVAGLALFLLSSFGPFT